LHLKSQRSQVDFFAMGALNLILDQARGHSERARLARRPNLFSRFSIFVVIGLASGLADPSQTLSDESVSTRPTDVHQTAAVHKASDPDSTPHVPALTRAAARQRIDEMSPAEWLSQFGHVAIGHRE
jgi:hypothetical protein